MVSLFFFADFTNYFMRKTHFIGGYAYEKENLKSIICISND